MPVNETTTEAIRVMTICNACRYCEGHCAVFPAMERQTEFTQNNIEFLSNLCHQCGACYQHCQYADPHEFDINVPAVFEQARLESYTQFLWPAFMQPAVLNGSKFMATSLLVSISLFLLAVAGQVGVSQIVAPQVSFYNLMPHSVMASIFSFSAVVVVISWWMTLRGYWHSISLPSPWSIGMASYSAAIASALTLKNLDGGHGDGCYESGESPSLWKRRYHHLVLIGLFLCFSATLAGTFYHYGLNVPAPYNWLTLPKILGMTGGIILLVGCVGLFRIKQTTDQRLVSNDNGYGMSLTVLLFLTSLTGLALPIAKGTGALGLLLAVHLGCVLALFLNFAWGKFTHGFFRLIALLADEHQKTQ